MPSSGQNAFKWWTTLVLRFVTLSLHNGRGGHEHQSLLDDAHPPATGAWRNFQIQVCELSGIEAEMLAECRRQFWPLFFYLGNIAGLNDVAHALGCRESGC